MSDHDEFYVGYLAAAPPRIASFVRRVTGLLLLVTIAIAGGLAVFQQPFPPKVFEWNRPGAHAGWLATEPYPHLVVPRTGDGPPSYSRYLLVAPGKFGAEEMASPFAGRWVELQGSLVYREDQTMLEVVPGSIRSAPAPAPAPVDRAQDLGVASLVGEIVDSKCFLGVMAPGSAKTHRACATRCISGGIPPILVVRDREGSARYFLLVGEDGRAVNTEVLPLVAEPVQIRGRVERHGSMLVLRSDPSTYRRWQP